MKEEDIKLLINDYKLIKANKIFEKGNFNFSLYKYSLDKVCREESIDKEESEIKFKEAEGKVSYKFKNNNFIIMTVAIIAITLSVLGSNYYFYVLNKSSIVPLN